MNEARHLIFFDGYCGVCDAFIAKLMPYAKGAGFRFAPLESAAFQELSGRHPELKGVDSIVFAENFGETDERVQVRSAALLEILRRLPGYWSLVRIFVSAMPLRLRDSFYDWFARHRHKVLGRRESCRLPTPTEREFFLS